MVVYESHGDLFVYPKHASASLADFKLQPREKDLLPVPAASVKQFVLVSLPLYSLPLSSAKSIISGKSTCTVVPMWQPHGSNQLCLSCR